jgi:hypothetical protein
MAMVLANGDRSVSGMSIVSPGMGIKADNATRVGTLNISDTIIQSSDYNMYIGWANEINLTRVRGVTGTGSASEGWNPYGLRIQDAAKVRIVDSEFDNSASGPAAAAAGKMNKNSIRLAGITEAGSGIFNSRIKGGQIMLGGGTANEREGWSPFGNFTISGGSFECTDPMATPLEIYGRVGEAGPVVIENWNVTSASGRTSHSAMSPSTASR